LPGPFPDAGRILRTELESKMPAWKEQCHEWQQRLRAEEMLQRTIREVEEARATMTAARQAWTQNLEKAEDPGESEKVYQEAKQRADLLEERLAALRTAAERWKKVTEELWDKFRAEFIQERRQLAEDRFQDAERYIATNDATLHVRRIAFEEFAVLTRFQLGLAGLRGICPLT
jgi:hypothetical protein